MKLRRLWNDVEGQNITEYALVFALVVLSALAASRGLTTALANVFQNSTQHSINSTLR